MRHSFPHNLDKTALTYVESALVSSMNARDFVVDPGVLSFECGEDVAADIVAKHVKNLISIARSVHKDVLYEHHRDTRRTENVMDILARTKQTVSIAPGIFSYSGFFLSVFNALERHAELLARKHGAIEIKYPPVWPIDLYRKIKYVDEFPQLMLLTAGVKDTFEARRGIATAFKSPHTSETVAVNEMFDKCRMGLCSAVCDACYFGLQKSIVENTVYSMEGFVFRNETSSTASLDRLTAFSVRDIVAIGDKEFVLLKRQQIIDDIIALVKALGLDCRIETANDPFFGTSAPLKSGMQYAERLKYEILARIDHANDYIAVGSVNFHLDFFGRAFEISQQSGEPAYSQCVGIGFDRLTYALCSQYGCKAEDWPTEITNFLGR